jgi:hypothetical protein
MLSKPLSLGEKVHRTDIFHMPAQSRAFAGLDHFLICPETDDRFGHGILLKLVWLPLQWL